MTVLSTFSSSAVWEAVVRSSDTAVPDADLDTIPPVMLEQLASDLSAQIGRSAEQAARRARQAVDFLTGVGVYGDLSDKRQRRAAEVVELFRDGRVTSNAGHLDAYALQQQIVRAIREGGSLIYELGWGQAKRSIGGLKTAGDGVDLAEIIAIARLAALTRASQLLLKEPVTLRILSGGQRFYEALFTRPRADEAYNDQRAAVASLLEQDDVVGVQRQAFGDPVKLRQQLAESDVAPHHMPSAAQLRFVQLSIDWEHLFELADEHPPHDLPSPAGFSSVWAHLPRSERDVLLRRLFQALVHGSGMDASSQCGQLLNEQTFQRTVDWMVDVARESAIKYALLGEITRRDSGPRDRDPRTSRLTVIEKQGQDEVPVLTLLGSRSRNCLPQHVVPMVQDEHQVAFAPRMSVPAHHRLVQANMVGESPQPLFFTDTSAKQALETLRRSNIVDIG